MQKKVRELEVGDIILYDSGYRAYTILEIGERGGVLEAFVQWHDGGTGRRLWALTDDVQNAEIDVDGTYP